MTHEQCSLATNLELATVYCCLLESTKGRALRVFLVTLLPNDMAVCFNHADYFEIDHFDQNFHLIFWLKVNNDTVFEACILEYDRYEPRLDASLCLDILPKNETHPDMFFKGATLPQNSHLLISLPLFCNYER